MISIFILWSSANPKLNIINFSIKTFIRSNFVKQVEKKMGQHQYKRIFDCLILLCMVQQLRSCYLGVDLKLGGTETFDETIKGHYENIIYDLEKSAEVTTYRNVPEQLADHDYNFFFLFPKNCKHSFVNKYMCNEVISAILKFLYSHFFVK